jgi:GrpB-like predicted nucleotidyltransferase (UPF0157 family)
MPTATVRLVAYDPTWPLEFDAEVERIERACDGLPIKLEHIGSTSIPGLSAKPVIDILAGRPGNIPGARYVNAFKQLGYEHKGAYGIPGRNYFRKGVPRTHHVHLVSWSSNLWRDHLLFRDYLRAHPEIAREYETIKRELATMYLQDKEQYTDAKGPFVRSIVRRAREEGYDVP